MFNKIRKVIRLFGEDKDERIPMLPFLTLDYDGVKMLDTMAKCIVVKGMFYPISREYVFQQFADCLPNAKVEVERIRIEGEIE